MLITFAALFGSVALLQLSSGAISPIDAIGGLQNGFTPTQVGLLGSCQFIGFFIGCWLAPRWMGNLGHARVFSVFAACGAIGAIAHPLYIDPWFWAGLRVLTGFCISGCYTVVEAWINASVNNETRGRVTGAYRSVDLGASLMAQLMISVLPPAIWTTYNLLAILCCLCLIPVALTQTKLPVTSTAPKLRPLKTLRVSPLAAAGVVIAGVTSSSFRMVGPVYGQEVGLSIDKIGIFLATFVLGGALAQLPAGWIADKFDRRWVLVWLSISAVLACAGAIVLGSTSQTAVFATALLFGFVTFPIFSVAAAHANDFAPASDAVEVSASLMFLFGLGAIASPLSVTYLIEQFGPSALFVFLASAHIVLAVFGGLRMLSRPTVGNITPYRYIPRTTFILGRLFNRK